MNITKEQVTKLLDFVEAYAGVSPEHECATILRGLADAEPVNRCITELLAFAKDHPGTYIFPSWDGSRVMKYLATSPQAAQTAVKSESLAQAAKAPAQLPSEGKTIEALAPTEAQEREAFEAWLKSEYLQTTREPDSWGRMRYTQSIECMWKGYQAGRAGRKG